MNANFFYLTAAMAIISLFCYPNGANAQAFVVEEVSVLKELPGKVHYYSESNKNNWFMSLGAGGQTFFTEHQGKQRYTLAMDFAIGKWISPVWGMRLSAMGGALHTNYYYDANVMTHMRYAAVYLDVMWDMFNTFNGYKEDRVFSIIPFMGAGGIYSFHNTPYGKKTYAFPVTAGIKLNFCLSHYIDLFFEGRGVLIGDHFNGIVQNTEVDGIVSVVGGLTFKFGKERFKPYNAYADQLVISELNSRVNTLRRQLNDCQSREVECPPCPEPVVQEKVVERSACGQELTSSVAFSINSSEVSEKEMVNVYNIAQWMKNNPTCQVTIIGYADKNTGTSQYNKELSQRRAETVRDILVNQYSINSSRIKIIAQGSESQLYPNNNDWNRIVVFSGSVQ